MNHKNYHKENLKNHILELVIQMIKNNGYQTISVRKIAKELAVSPTAIYRHYASLDSLCAQAVNVISQEFTNYLTSVYDYQELSSATAELEIIGYQFIKYALVSKNEFDFLFLSEYSLKDVSLDGTKDTPLIKLMDAVIERLKKSHQGYFNKQLLFKQIWSFIFGYAVLVSKKELELDKKVIDATIQSLLK